jgi:hypothetical protein
MSHLPPGLGAAADFRRAVELIDAGDVAQLRAQLREHPGLARQRVGIPGAHYFSKPSLLDFIAQNPVSLCAPLRRIVRRRGVAGGTRCRRLESPPARSATALLAAPWDRDELYASSARL